MDDREIRFAAHLIGRIPPSVALMSKWELIGCVMDALRKHKVSATIAMTKRQFRASVLVRHQWFTKQHARPDVAIIRAARIALPAVVWEASRAAENGGEDV